MCLSDIHNLGMMEKKKKARKKKCHGLNVSKPKVALNRNKSFLQKSTLRDNNRALAQALEMSRQEARITQESNIELLKELQYLQQHIHNLERISGLKNQEIEIEVHKRCKKYKVEMKLLLDEVASKLFDAVNVLGSALNLCSNPKPKSIGKSDSTNKVEKSPEDKELMTDCNKKKGSTPSLFSILGGEGNSHKKASAESDLSVLIEQSFINDKIPECSSLSSSFLHPVEEESSPKETQKQTENHEKTTVAARKSKRLSNIVISYSENSPDNDKTVTKKNYKLPLRVPLGQNQENVFTESKKTHCRKSTLFSSSVSLLPCKRNSNGLENDLEPKKSKAKRKSSTIPNDIFKDVSNPTTSTQVSSGNIVSNSSTERHCSLDEQSVSKNAEEKSEKPCQNVTATDKRLTFCVSSVHSHLSPNLKNVASENNYMSPHRRNTYCIKNQSTKSLQSVSGNEGKLGLKFQSKAANASNIETEPNLSYNLLFIPPPCTPTFWEADTTTVHPIDMELTGIIESEKGSEVSAKTPESSLLQSHQDITEKSIVFQDNSYYTPKKVISLNNKDNSFQKPGDSNLSRRKRMSIDKTKKVLLKSPYKRTPRPTTKRKKSVHFKASSELDLSIFELSLNDSSHPNVNGLCREKNSIEIKNVNTNLSSTKLSPCLAKHALNASKITTRQKPSQQKVGEKTLEPSNRLMNINMTTNKDSAQENKLPSEVQNLIEKIKPVDVSINGLTPVLIIPKCQAFTCKTPQLLDLSIKRQNSLGKGDSIKNNASDSKITPKSDEITSKNETVEIAKHSDSISVGNEGNEKIESLVKQSPNKNVTPSPIIALDNNNCPVVHLKKKKMSFRKKIRIRSIEENGGEKIQEVRETNNINRERKSVIRNAEENDREKVHDTREINNSNKGKSSGKRKSIIKNLDKNGREKIQQARGTNSIDKERKHSFPFKASNFIKGGKKKAMPKQLKNNTDVEQLTAEYSQNISKTVGKMKSTIKTITSVMISHSPEVPEKLRCQNSSLNGSIFTPELSPNIEISNKKIADVTPQTCQIKKSEIVKRKSENVEIPTVQDKVEKVSNNQRINKSEVKISSDSDNLNILNDQENQRPRRAGKPINFKEPSLNKKLRQGNKYWFLH